MSCGLRCRISRLDKGIVDLVASGGVLHSHITPGSRDARSTEISERSESSLAVVRRQQADLASFRTALEGLEREHAARRSEYRELLEALAVPDDVSSLTIDT